MALYVDPLYYVLVFAMGAGGALFAMKRKDIPWAEIYLKKGPIAWIKFSDRQKLPYDISKQKNGYFILYTKKVKGIFKIDPKYIYFMGKTPCYDYTIKNMNPIDDELLNELNNFLNRNKLTKLKRKHIRHSTLFKSNPGKIQEIKNKLQKKENVSSILTQNAISEGREAINDYVQNLSDKTGKPVVLESADECTMLANYLKTKGIINTDEHATLIYKIENGTIGFGELIEELNDMHVIDINEPLDERVEGMLEDFGSQDPLNMSGLVDDLREAKKGLKSMTPVPVKSFVPAGVILAAGLIGIFVIVLISNGTIPLDPSKWTGGGGNPFGNMKIPGFSFIESLLSKLG